MAGNNQFQHDEHAFDIEAPPILPTDDLGDNGDPEDSFMGGVEMDVNDDNVNEELEVTQQMYYISLLGRYYMLLKQIRFIRNSTFMYLG